MKQFLVVGLALIAAATPVKAYLGDDSDRVDDLYRNLMKRRLRDDGTVSVLYGKDEYLYRVIFGNDRSILESYSHTNGKDLSEKEIAKFLKANAVGGTWIAENTAKERRFKRSDGRAVAAYGITEGRPALTVRELRPPPDL
jgi:hypothetical protein